MSLWQRMKAKLVGVPPPPPPAPAPETETSVRKKKPTETGRRPTRVPVQEPTDAAGWVEHATELLRSGEHQRALEGFTKAIELDAALAKAYAGRGVAYEALGRPEEGLSDTERGIALYQNLPTPPVFWPQILGLRAQATAMAGRIGDALDLFDQGLAVGGEGTFDSAALKLQKAEVLLNTGDRQGGEALLRAAFLEASQIRVPMLQLMAATGLAQLGAHANGRSARDALRELYESFSEGFDTPHLVDARAALEH